MQLLIDLQALAARQGHSEEVARRIRALSEEHARKWSFVERLRQAGLVKTAR